MVFALLVVLVLAPTMTACRAGRHAARSSDSEGDGSVDILGGQRLRAAVAASQLKLTYRVRGELGGRVRWEGYVAGPEEEYLIQLGGLQIESRRMNGGSFALRLDIPNQSWEQVESDNPLDLPVLLRGTVEDSQVTAGDHLRVTLLFDGVDVLAALTHIRSVGVTTAIVDISNGLVETISLHFADASQASMTYWDYGAQLAVDPVPKTG